MSVCYVTIGNTIAANKRRENVKEGRVRIRAFGKFCPYLLCSKVVVYSDR